MGKKSEGGHVVFWSGGKDSTLVALDLLRARKYIHLVTFVNPNIGGESHLNKENIARKRILQKLRHEFGEKAFHYEEFTWNGNAVTGNLGQASFWVSLFPLICADKDKAYFGIIRYSDFWHKRAQFERSFHAICKFQDKEVELVYPLEWTKKPEIIKRLKKLGYNDMAIHSGDKL